MRQKIIPIILMAILLFTSNSFAQKLDLDGVGDVYLRNSGAIYNDNAVKGYFFFYKASSDKKGRNADATYIVKILDQNLNEVSEKTFESNKYILLQEVTYNETALLFKFYDLKESASIYKKLDADGKFVVLKTEKISGAIAKGLAAQSAQGYTGDQVSLFGINKNAFVGYGYSKEGKSAGYIINYFGEDNKKWTAKSDPDSKMIEWATYIGASDEVVLSMLLKRKGMMSKDFDNFILAHDIKTGKKLFEKSLVFDKYTTLPLNFYVSNAGETTIVGLYFPADDKELKGKSIGMSFIKMDKSGEVLSSNYSSWTKEMSKFLPESEKSRIGDGGHAFIHKIIQDKDENTFIVAEQYRKQASAGGLAMKMLGGSAAGAEVVINDLMVFKYDKNFNILGIDNFEKSQSKQMMPAGAGLMNPLILGMFTKSFGGFDYEFTQVDRADNSFYIGIIDLEKNKNAEARSDRKKWVFSSIGYLDGAEPKVEKLELENEATDLRVYEAKPGYVMISEYYKKEKRISLRLEKLNF